MYGSMSANIIMKTIAKILIPFILVFGIYVVVNGADSVGGGFQGGAILAAAFIVRWMVLPSEDFDISFLKKLERVFLIVLIALSMLLIGQSMQMSGAVGRLWMVGINLLIGVKVCCGLTIVFYRFVFFESRGTL